MKLWVVAGAISTAAAMAGKDFYASFCSSALGNIALDGNVTIECTGKKNYECFCTNQNYRTNLAHCIDAAALNDTLARTVSWNAFRRQCARVGHDSVVPSDISTQLELPSSVSVPQDIIDEMHTVAKAHYAETNASDVYGIILLCYVLGAIGLMSVFNSIVWFFPKVGKKIGNSSVGRAWRIYMLFPTVRTSGRWLGLTSVPNVLNCLVLCGYVVLTGVFLGVGHKTEALVSPMLFPSKQVAVIWGLGRRASAFALYNAPLVFLFGGRNNVLTALSGASREYFNMWHRWLARVMVAELIVHAAAHTQWALLFHALAKFWTFIYYRWGVASIMSMGLMVLLSLPVFRRLSYDTFKLIHTVLAVVALVGAWYHIKDHWIGREHLLACIGIWAVEHGINLLRIGALVSRPWGTKVSVIAHDTDEVIEITIDTHDVALPLEGVGEFVYVHFLTGRHFWQAHPFTVVRVPKQSFGLQPAIEETEMKLLFKARGGVTRRLFEQYQGSFTTVRVWLAGPYYADSFNMSGYTEIVFVAGGIGITAVYAQVCRLMKTNTTALASVDWYVPAQSTLEWFDKPLRHMSELANVTMHTSEHSGSSTSVFVEDSMEKYTSIDFDDASDPGNSRAYDLVLERIRTTSGPMLVFVCGPERMHSAVQDAVRRGIGLTNHYVSLHQERFAS